MASVSAVSEVLSSFVDDVSVSWERIVAAFSSASADWIACVCVGGRKREERERTYVNE